MLNKEIKIQNIEYDEADDGFVLKVKAKNKEFFIIVEDDFFNKNNKVRVDYDEKDFTEDEVTELTKSVFDKLNNSIEN